MKDNLEITPDGISNPNVIEVPCPTCKRRGTVTDPNCFGKMISYYNPMTGTTTPQVKCRTCNGEGWIKKNI